MKERIQQIAEAHGWHFDYGRADFHNLSVEVRAEFYLFLDPLEELVTFNDFNGVQARTYSGRFMISRNSDFDRVYDAQQGGDVKDGKYEQYIKPCKERAMEVAYALCPEFGINQWRMIEAINVYDDNFDGVIVVFQLTKTE